jgi:hypothetical protein
MHHGNHRRDRKSEEEKFRKQKTTTKVTHDEASHRKIAPGKKSGIVINSDAVLIRPLLGTFQAHDEDRGPRNVRDHSSVPKSVVMPEQPQFSPYMQRPASSGSGFIEVKDQREVENTHLHALLALLHMNWSSIRPLLTTNPPRTRSTSVSPARLRRASPSSNAHASTSSPRQQHTSRRSASPPGEVVVGWRLDTLREALDGAGVHATREQLAVLYAAAGKGDSGASSTYCTQANVRSTTVLLTCADIEELMRAHGLVVQTSPGRQRDSSRRGRACSEGAADKVKKVLEQVHFWCMYMCF